jgi:hypothetical protein
MASVPDYDSILLSDVSVENVTVSVELVQKNTLNKYKAP